MPDDPIASFPGVPAPSQNGHRTTGRAALRDQRPLRGVPSGVAAAAAGAAIAVPRILLLNLALFNPWPRPVAVAAAAGGLTGLLRRGGSHRAAAIAGAGAAAAGLMAAYLGVRLSVPVLWVDRSPARVVAADLLRLVAYAVVPGALGATAGRALRAAARRVRNARALAKPPIRHL